MTTFVDRVVLHAAAGDGGHGCASVHREKYKPLGGPDGGNGGRGGDVVLRVEPSTTTLLDYHHRPHRRAGSGRPGQGGNRNGADGADEVLTVPDGTPACGSGECHVFFFGESVFYGSAIPGPDWTAAIQTSWADAGTYPVTAQFFGSARFAIQAATTLNQVIDEPVTPGPGPGPQGIVITSPPPPDAVRLQPYRFKITATGAPAPTFRIVAGWLPDGLQLHSNGEIVGVPLKPGQSHFTVEVSNGAAAKVLARLAIHVRVKPKK